ncbi:MAG: adenylate kinase [Microgenomates group bacterium Gr01-1014_80]|nr:MAG: adenylate kinase [Microgenomates group bacterium Gr01-1014_80]
MKVLLVGPQGSGKSTQSKLLADYLGVPYIETGQIFRDMSEENTSLGEKVKALLSAGEMVPDDITSEIVKTGLESPDYGNGFVMNGYPRNLNQIKLFDPGFDKVFYLKVSDDEVISRLLKRAREDDTRELIERRLSDYHSLTEPILGHYQNSGLLEEIDGSGGIEAVQQTLRGKVNG